MRKTIYFRDDGSWEAIKGSAESEGISVSRYIVNKCLGSGVVSKTLIKDSGQLNRIEEKIDTLLSKPVSKMLDAVYKDESGTISDAKTSKSISKRVAAQKPKKVIKTVEDIPEWVGGFSKEQQVGKKAKK